MTEKGLVIAYTGDGKGKTTAALGIVVRALGYKQKVCMIQFIKGSWHYGELDSAKKLAPEFELITAGKGFVGIIDDTSPKDEHKRSAEDAIQISKKKILENIFDIIILDEVNYAINLDLIKVEDILELIKIKPEKLTLVLTGNHVRPEIVDIADLVTEMKKIKHPYESGQKAKKGIDF